jgi:hypothetical protein
VIDPAGEERVRRRRNENVARVDQRVEGTPVFDVGIIQWLQSYSTPWLDRLFILL